MVPLHRELRSGDAVEILTSANQKPSKDWLHFVKTSKARQLVRRTIREEEFAASMALGQEMLEKECRRNRVKRPDDEDLQEVADHFTFESPDALLAAVGRGELTITQVWNALFPEEKASEPKPISAFERLVEKIKGGHKGVRTQGLDNMMVRFSQCCQPIPGDDVLGYVTRGRGVSIHRTDCPNVLNLTDSSERKVDLSWDTRGSETFIVRLVVLGTDRRGLFADVAGAVSRTSTDIKSADLNVNDVGIEGTFVVEVADLEHLTRVIESMKSIEGILEVERKEYFGSHALDVHDVRPDRAVGD